MTDIKDNAVPHYVFDCLTDITVEDLKGMAVKLVAIDLDNTSVYDSTFTPIKGVKTWIKNVKKAGFPVVIISNSFELRAKIIGKKFGCKVYGAAAKPDKKYFLKAAEDAGIKINELVLIGDRIFTDVVGANSCGAVSVYVKPYRKEFMIPFYWKKARQEEVDFLKTINIVRNLKTIYYK